MIFSLISTRPCGLAIPEAGPLRKFGAETGGISRRQYRLTDEPSTLCMHGFSRSTRSTKRFDATDIITENDDRRLIGAAASAGGLRATRV